MSKIEVKNVSVQFKQQNKQVDAVKNVSFSIEKGEIFGIVGLSGAGKSTLVRTLNLLTKPVGSIKIDGIEITNKKGGELAKIRQNIGMIFQHFNLIQNRTIAQNIEFALKSVNYPKEKRDARIEELLELVDLSDKKDNYPSTLSGGQKQRVGIARALANNPEILLCDEATSALDLETTEEILTLLKKINVEFGITMIFITHELDVALRFFDRVAVMENGEIVELRDTYDLFSNPQSNISKTLVGRFLQLELPREIKQSLHDGLLLELHYQGSEAINPVISQISKNLLIDISIIHGNIFYVKNRAIGVLVVFLQGDSKNIIQAKKALEKEVNALKEIEVRK